MEQLDEGLAGEAGGRDASVRIARERPGGARRIGEAQRQPEPLSLEARLDLGQQPRLAAEQVRNARNVEHQTVGAIERDERRIARAGVREALEQLGLPGRIGLADDERGMARARVGERQARAQAEARGVRVDANEPTRVSDHGDRRERRRGINPVRAPRAIRRQTRPPEGEKSTVRQTACPRFSKSGG